ncbi:MAG: hypothetical protein GX653_09495, partial [Clostridiales bacterium]|nr:hypothetical protein [Clostridiales bacterium]
REFKYVKGFVKATADQVIAESGVGLHYQIGTMLEIPRAALTADEIAEEAEFFSFGTNDLTQMTFGFSRDDAGKFLPSYYEKGIFESDPFERLDQTGVGKLVEMAATLGRATRPALKVRKEKGIDVKPEIMIPLVGTVKELKFVKEIVLDTAEKIFSEQGEKIEFQVGTMIEIPRACVVADEIAKEAEFFSFGTNDLTQMTFGFSRDDAGKFLDAYYDNKILESDPFARLDQEGVGELVKMAVEKGRQGRPNIKLGICGEHGGDPSTVEFCHNVGLNYVSCSPFRVPIARLAAAHAAIKEKQAK